MLQSNKVNRCFLVFASVQTYNNMSVNHACKAGSKRLNFRYGDVQATPYGSSRPFVNYTPATA